MAGSGMSATDRLMQAATAPAPRTTLTEQLGRISAGLTDRNLRIVRALDILARHPEFEEFLDLQDLLAEIGVERCRR